MQLKPLPEKTELNRSKRLIIPCFETFFDETGDRPVLTNGAQAILRRYQDENCCQIAIANTQNRDSGLEEVVLYFQYALKYTPWIQSVVFCWEGAGYWVTRKSEMAYIDRNLPPGDRPGIGSIWLTRHVVAPRTFHSPLVIGSCDADFSAAEKGGCYYLDFDFLKEEFCEQH